MLHHLQSDRPSGAIFSDRLSFIENVINFRQLTSESALEALRLCAI